MPAAIDRSLDDRLIRRPEARRRYLGGISESTEWRRLRNDPEFPQLSADGRHYRLSELQRYIRLSQSVRSRRERGESAQTR
jgi:hypothetical protein